MRGGELVASGTLTEVLANPHSLTGRYLNANGSWMDEFSLIKTDYSPGTSVNGPDTGEANIFPNPFSDRISFEPECLNCSWNIHNLSGQALLSGKTTNESELDLSALPKGVYILSFTEGSGFGTGSFKIVKQ